MSEMQSRRYTWKLYPTQPQEECLRRQCVMVAQLWNALLERYETIQRRTTQRQNWKDGDRKRRGVSVHATTWQSQQKKAGELVTFDTDHRYSQYDMQNEVTWMLNEIPEWRELSCWTPLRTAALLDRAIKAFYSRAASGAGASSGYPRFKRTDKHNSIPHRFASGCKLEKDDRHERSWRLTLKGIPGAIHARGILPADISKLTDADIIHRDGAWWLSAGCEIEPRRHGGHRHVNIRFDLIDGLARVNGHLEIPDGIPAIQALQDNLDSLKADCDLRWPRGKRRDDDQQELFREARAAISDLSGLIRRRRADALHVWTARLVRDASDIKVVAPPVRSSTKTARGDEREWGANVETVAQVNKTALSYAPAMVIAMLKYKAAEAEIPCEVVEDSSPVIAVGGDLNTAGKKLRKAKRELKKAA